MAEQLQSAVGIRLVLPISHEPERRRRRSCPVDHLTERIITERIRHTLAAVGDAACTSQRIPMCQYKVRQSTPTSFSTL